MYQEHFTFDALPFENTPDPRFFFESDQHREAVAAVEYAVRQRKGFVLVTGTPGSGKTLVGRLVAGRCTGQGLVASLLPGAPGAEAFTRQILRAIGVSVEPGAGYDDALDTLRRALAQQAQRNQPVILIIDDAQDLDDAALHHLRMLTNHDTAHQRALIAVLIGHEELRDRLCANGMESLRQRVALAKQLTPMDLEQTGHYVRHRLQTAHGDGPLPVRFTEQAIYEIHAITQGVPRLINTLCDNCLLMAFVQQEATVHTPIVRQVKADMLPTFVDDRGAAPRIAAQTRQQLRSAS